MLNTCAQSVAFFALLSLPPGTCAAVAEKALQQGDYGRAIAEASEAQRIDHELGNVRAEKEDLYAIGLAKLFLGDYPQAGNIFVRVLAMDRQTADREGEVIRLKDLGNVRYFEASYSDADRLYGEARHVLDANLPRLGMTMRWRLCWPIGRCSTSV